MTPQPPSPAALLRTSPQVHADLVRLAQAWPTTYDPDEVPTDSYAAQFPEVHRCGREDCAQRIVPFTTESVVAHLMRSHGFRMDGRAFDNDNRQTTTAQRELEALRAGS